MISCREHGHLRVWVPEAKLELRCRHWGPVVGASHLQDWQKICQESSLRSSDSSWKKPLCPSTQTLHWRVSLLCFSEDRRASEVPLLECRSLQRARSLTGWNCVEALLGDEWGLETTTVSQSLLRKKLIQVFKHASRLGSDSYKWLWPQCVYTLTEWDPISPVCI